MVPVNAVAWAVVSSWSFPGVVGPNTFFNELGGAVTLSVSHADVLTEFMGGMGALGKSLELADDLFGLAYHVAAPAEIYGRDSSFP